MQLVVVKVYDNRSPAGFFHLVARITSILPSGDRYKLCTKSTRIREAVFEVEIESAEEYDFEELAFDVDIEKFHLMPEVNGLVEALNIEQNSSNDATVGEADDEVCSQYNSVICTPANCTTGRCSCS